MTNYKVVFISTPAIGNLVPTVEFVRHLTSRDPRLSATILILTIDERTVVNAYIQSIAASTPPAVTNFIHLPALDPPTPDQYQSSLGYISLYIEKQKSNIKNALLDLMSTKSFRVSGLFVDMFCTAAIDVAEELGVPCYLFFASPASFLGFMLHLPALGDKLATEFVDSPTGLIIPKDSATELIVPSFANPLAPPVLPTIVLKRKRDGYFWYLHHARRYRETKGIVVNTFLELEPFAINSVSKGGFPPVYPVGPIIDLAGPVQWHPNRGQHESIMRWLDDQPPSSVVLLCFGSMGSLGGPQLREIAHGLELAEHRFLWSIREPPKAKLDLPGEYNVVEEVLPAGFLDRTAGIGLVCGWIPQVSILAHQAIGGFVSHCGWNSVLESLWYGVPIATWPLYAEQQMNAFQLVKELGLAVEIRVDYREGSDLVLAEEFANGLTRLMDGGDEVKRKAKEMKHKSRKALMDDGSSYRSLGSLLQELVAEI
ncbi:hypothetical protein SLE2022_255350 [Rubroshorea leprosula]